MRRIRNKLALAFLVLVSTGVLGTAFLTSRAFVSDKRSYVTELNSVAAPNIAAAIGKQLDYLEDQLTVLDDLFTDRDPQQRETSPAVVSIFKNLRDIQSIDLYRSGRWVRRISETVTPLKEVTDSDWQTRMESVLRRRLLIRSGIPGLISPVGESRYWVSLQRRYFQEIIKVPSKPFFELRNFFERLS